MGGTGEEAGNSTGKAWAEGRISLFWNSRVGVLGAVAPCFTVPVAGTTHGEFGCAGEVCGVLWSVLKALERY